MTLRTIVTSKDFLISLASGVACYYLLPSWVSNDPASNIYSVGISVVSIVFAVYFAALAIMISSGDDRFIQFMEIDGSYSELIRSFQFTLGLLFVSLLVSIGAYSASVIWKEQGHKAQFTWVASVFVFFFLYGLCASFYATLDCIQYAKRRVEFLNIVGGPEPAQAEQLGIHEP